MNKQLQYTKTSKGLRALQNCAKLLDPQQCLILALVNGKFSIEEIQARVPPNSNREFLQNIDLLVREAYIRLLPNTQDDIEGPPSVLGVEELDTEHGVQEWASATRAAEMLKESGYYLPTERQAKSQQQRQILVIDDEPAIGKAVAIVLGAAGFAVESIEDPRLALEKIKSKPDLALVLLDVVMPEESGFAILRQIRGQPQLHRLPVVMLTAHSDPEYVAQGLREGADGYILKPFKPEKLINYLEDTLKIKHQDNAVPAN